MKKDTQLATLIRDDVNLAHRIKEIAKEVEKDTAKIKRVAESYNQRYKKEIAAGTIKKHLLLEEGKKKGKSVEEIEQSSGFIPCIYTPILNWLYFMVMEGRNIEQEYIRGREDELHRTLLHEEVNTDKVPDVIEYIYGNITMEKFQTLKKLKRLSKSPNEHEAFSAYRKCISLCKEHGIEFDKIPT